MSRSQSHRLTRRHVLAAGAAAMIPLRAQTASAAATLGEDGLYHMGWYLESFLDIADDLAAATAKGKRFAILWGLKGCPACKQMHTVYMADPKVEAYIRDNFEIVHLNILGAREVTDFGGKKLGEKPFSALYGIQGTPSIQFFPESADGLAAKPPAKREVARMTGLFEKDAFLAMFRYVRTRGYDSAPFAEWLKRPA